MNLRLIKDLCKMDEKTIHSFVMKTLVKAGYKSFCNAEDYIIAEGDLPICLISHLDTVFSFPPQQFFFDYREKVLWSPTGSGFDDRAGVYIILTLIEMGYRPHIIFTHGEEIGGIGSRDLITRFPQCPFKECKALIQLDRANKNDMVFYDCNNSSFEKYIGKFGFKFAWGSFSDISVIAPAWEIAAVNLSVGYLNEHTTSELLYTDQCDNTLKKVEQILNKSDTMPSFTYIPYKYQNFKMYPCESAYITDRKCFLCLDEFTTENPAVEVQEYGSIPKYKVCKRCYDAYYVSS